MRSLCSLLFSVLLFSCTNQQSPSFLNREALPKQIFRIATTRDTVIKTAGGAVLKIDKGSLTGGGAVDLEVKEAYSFEDIIKAGLTTQSNGQALGSGGMIYIDAVDKNVTIAKPILISLPTKEYDVEMKLYKGVEKDGNINWTDPKIFPDTLSAYLQHGKTLFNAECATCHMYDKIIQGPALAGLESRGPWKNRMELLKFTINPGNYIAHNCYARELASQFNGQIMPSFPMYYESDTIVRMKNDLNALYDYLRAEDIKRGVDLTNHYVVSPCEDSCLRYDSVRLAVEGRLENLELSRRELILSNDDRVNYERLNNTGTARLPDLRDEQGVIPKDLVDTTNYKAVYYRFDVKSFGWYNVDKLLAVAKGEECLLSVSIDDNLLKEPDVFIAVPKYKTFERGGKLPDGIHYSFFTKDGKMPLPIGVNVVIFTFGEVNGNILFDAKQFVATAENNVQLVPKSISRDTFNAAIKGLALGSLSVQINDAKNSGEIKKVDEETIRQKGILESFRPKNCDCNCGQKPLEPEKDVGKKINFKTKLFLRFNETA